MGEGVLEVFMPQLAQHLKWTYEDFLLFPDDGKRHELIDGEHIMSPSPFTKHQRILGNLFIVIKLFLKSHRMGEAFIAPMDVVLSDTDVVEPDLLFIASEHASIITEKHIMGVPDLIVEVLSEGSGTETCATRNMSQMGLGRKTDEIIKRRLYEQYGVKEYWIIDPELESVKARSGLCPSERGAWGHLERSEQGPHMEKVYRWHENMCHTEHVPNSGTGMQSTGFVRVAELSVENGGTLTTPLLPDLTIPLSDIFG